MNTILIVLAVVIPLGAYLLFLEEFKDFIDGWFPDEDLWS